MLGLEIGLSIANGWPNYIVIDYDFVWKAQFIWS